MSKVEIPDIKSQFASTNALNTRFQAIEDTLNDKVLFRDNPVGEPNTMVSDLDMGDQDIINVKTISAADFIVAGEDITTGVTQAAQEANQARDEAQAFAVDAENSAIASEASNVSSTAAKVIAETARDEAVAAKDATQSLKDEVTAEGNTQVNRVIAEGSAQSASILSTGNTERSSVQGVGDAQENRIITEGNTQVGRVSSEGDTQVARVTAEGNTQYNRIDTLSTTSQSEIQTIRDQSVNTMNSTSQDAIDDVNSATTSAVNTMNSTKTNAIAAVENSRDQAVDVITAIPQYHINYQEALQGAIKKDFRGDVIGEEGKWKLTYVATETPNGIIIKSDLGTTQTELYNTNTTNDKVYFGATSRLVVNAYGVIIGNSGTAYIVIFANGASSNTTVRSIRLHPKHGDVRYDFTVGSSYKVYIFHESSASNDQMTGDLDVTEYFVGAVNLMNQHTTTEGYREDQDALANLDEIKVGWRTEPVALNMTKAFTYDLRPRADYTSQYDTGSKIPYIDALRFLGPNTDPDSVTAVSIYFNDKKVDKDVPYKFQYEYISVYDLDNFYLGLKIRIYSGRGGTGTLLQTIDLPQAQTGLRSHVVNQLGNGLTSWMETRQEEISFTPTSEGYAVITPYYSTTDPNEIVSLWKIIGLGQDTTTMSDYVTIPRNEVFMDFVSVRLVNEVKSLKDIIPINSYATLNIGYWKGKDWESNLLGDVSRTSSSGKTIVELPLNRKMGTTRKRYWLHKNGSWVESLYGDINTSLKSAVNENGNTILMNAENDTAVALGYTDSADLISNSAVKVEYKTKARVYRPDDSNVNSVVVSDKVYIFSATTGGGIPTILHDTIGNVPVGQSGGNTNWGSVVSSADGINSQSLGSVNYTSGVLPRYSSTNASAILFRLFPKGDTYWLQARFKELVYDSDWGSDYKISEDGSDKITSKIDDNGNVILSGVMSRDTGIPVNP